jgi:D-aspartate ligase
MLKEIIIRIKTININFIPVIFGGFVNAYSLARTFYETYTIKSIVCDTRKNIAAFSKICDFITIENPNKNETNFIDIVKKIGKNICINGKTPLLLVAGDNYLIPLAKHKRELENIYLYTFSGWEIIEKLVNKNKLYELSEVLDIPYPRTVCTNKNIQPFYHLVPPLLVKPSDGNEFLYNFPGTKRNNIFISHNEVKDYLKFIYSNNYKSDFIIQEYIPGGAENLYTCTTYSDSGGHVKGVSTGYKLSQYPSEAGTITSGITGYNKEIIYLTKVILEENEYFGIANTEFKYDKRDNTYKLMEVNARPGMWNYSTILSGINLVSLLVNDIVSKETLFYSEGCNSFIWTIISKKDVVKQIHNIENLSTVQELIKEKKIFNPIDNKAENLFFKIIVKSHIQFSGLKKFCMRLYKKIFSRI